MTIHDAAIDQLNELVACTLTDTDPRPSESAGCTSA
jgi:hypothetical protein